MYRMKFGRDIFVDMNKLKRQMDIQEKIKKETKEECEKKGEPFNEDEFESGLPLDSLEVFENISYLFTSMEIHRSRMISMSGWSSSKHLTSMISFRKHWTYGISTINRHQNQKKKPGNRPRSQYRPVHA